MTEQDAGNLGPGSPAELANPPSKRKAAPSKGEVGDQTEITAGASEDHSARETPLFTSNESARLLHIETPFQDSLPDYRVIQALEASAAARLALATRIDQALFDLHASSE